jgi:hypothetical protein
MALSLTTLLWSCDSKESGDENPEMEIALQTPASDASINLSQVNATAFSWTQVTEVSGYTLKFAPSEAELANTSVKIDAGNAASYSLDSQAADDMLAGNTSVQPGESTDMYWTVVPTVAVPNVKTQVRKFHVTRLPVAGTPRLSVSTELIVFAENPSEAQIVGVQANTAWNVSIAQTGEWLTASPSAGSGDGSISLTATENTGAERTAVVTVSGTGVESKTVSVIQAAKGSGITAALLGKWNLKGVEYIEYYTGNNREYKTTVTEKYVAPFTLNEDGSFTGEIASMSNENNYSSGDGIKTWSYANGLFTWVNEERNGYTATYKVTVTSSMLVFERGTPNSIGYGRAIYTKETVTLPPIPDQLNWYTGSESVLYGVWVLTKLESGYLYEGNVSWASESYNANDEIMKFTLNSDGTFQVVNNLDNTITWTFANGTLTITLGGGDQSVLKLVAESSTSTLVWGSIEDDRGEKVYSRMTWVKK